MAKMSKQDKKRLSAAKTAAKRISTEEQKFAKEAQDRARQMQSLATKGKTNGAAKPKPKATKKRAAPKRSTPKRTTARKAPARKRAAPKPKRRTSAKKRR